MRAIIGGLVAGFGTYYLIKWIREKKLNFPTTASETLVHGMGDEAGVYAYLFDLRNQIKNATGMYGNSVKKIEDLDMKIVKANDEYLAAEAERRPTILFRIAEIQRQRDLAVLEAELILRNVINPLREKLLTEEARLKSAVIAPEIALNRSGKIPSF